MVAAGAAAYAALIGLVTWQVEQGEPLAHPGVATLLAAGSLLSATIIVSLAVVVRAQRTTLASVRFRGQHFPGLARRLRVSPGRTVEGGPLNKLHGALQ
jgi:hypothetical protein